jgi:outer membrane protein assembly factor BamB
MSVKRIVIIMVCLAFYSLQAQVVSDWRNLDRSGVYNETGLLSAWPEEGPALLWYNDSLPKGYSSPAVTDEAIYLTGIIDTLDYVFALDHKGKQLWQCAFGNAWTKSFTDSRSTPVVEGDVLYVQSGRCDVACVNRKSGEIVWKASGEKEYGAMPGTWGYAESILVVDDKIVFSPAGDSTTMVALDKKTGKKVWKSAPLGDTAAYVSPLLVEKGDKKFILNVLSNFVIAVDAATGEIVGKHHYAAVDDRRAFALWKHHSASRINTNTPIYKDGEVYVTSGYNHSGVKYKVSDDFSSFEVVWVDSVLDVHHGGVVLIDGYLYGSNWINNRKGNWCCIDWNTGKAMYETEWETKGAIIAAEGMLYCYDEKRGNMALVKANPEKFEIISQFKVPHGKGPYWTHSVIKHRKLYVRHGEALMVYDIAAE